MYDRQFLSAMETIVAALREKGYDPYAQLTGYVKENEPAYITSHKGARQLILTLDKEQVEQYIKRLNKERDV